MRPAFRMVEIQQFVRSWHHLPTEERRTLFVRLARDQSTDRGRRAWPSAAPCQFENGPKPICRLAGTAATPFQVDKLSISHRTQGVLRYLLTCFASHHHLAPMVLAAKASFSGYWTGTRICSVRKSRNLNCLLTNPNSCKMQMMPDLTPAVIRERTAHEFLLIRPLSNVLELCGWAQARAARQEKLEQLHVTLLRHAVWNDGMVSFDGIHHETSLPRYVISRAAAKLEKRGFGKVKPDPENKRWHRLHITLTGIKCCHRIDSKTIQFLMMRFRRDGVASRTEDVTSYYTLASHIYNAARRLPRLISSAGAVDVPRRDRPWLRAKPNAEAIDTFP